MNKSAGPVTPRGVGPSGGFLPASWPAGVWAGAPLREHFTRRARAGFLYAIIGLPLGVAGFIFTVVSLGVGAYAALTVIGLPVICLSALGSRRLAAGHRHLARRLLAVRVPEPPPFRPRPGLIGWIRSALTDPVAWRARGYLILKLPVALAGFFVAALLWVAGPYWVSYPLWWEIFHRFTYQPSWATRPVPVLAAPLPIPRMEILSLPGTFLITALGVVAVLAAPWGTRMVNAVDVSLMRRLFGADTLSERVHELERTRAYAVNDSVARLRAIERDLHDGAQAHLVAVSMKLGLAREKLEGRDTVGSQPDVDRALQLVETAQSTAQDALEELRGLVRGIHPPVLDSGLEVALSSLTARSAVPVELIVNVPDRPAPAIETIAYFCVAELLANVAKHSQARRVAIEAVHIPGLLRVRVADDGTGGAGLEADGGLRGLCDRLRTVNGEMEISSPPGGPTVVTIELPSDV